MKKIDRGCAGLRLLRGQYRGAEPGGAGAAERPGAGRCFCALRRARANSGGAARYFRAIVSVSRRRRVVDEYERYAVAQRCVGRSRTGSGFLHDQGGILSRRDGRGFRVAEGDSRQPFSATGRHCSTSAATKRADCVRGCIWKTRPGRWRWRPSPATWFCSTRGSGTRPLRVQAGGARCLSAMCPIPKIHPCGRIRCGH